MQQPWCDVKLVVVVWAFEDGIWAVRQGQLRKVWLNCVARSPMLWVDVGSLNRKRDNTIGSLLVPVPRTRKETFAWLCPHCGPRKRAIQRCFADWVVGYNLADFQDPCSVCNIFFEHIGAQGLLNNSGRWQLMAFAKPRSTVAGDYRIPSQECLWYEQL